MFKSVRFQFKKNLLEQHVESTLTAENINSVVLNTESNWEAINDI